MNPRSKYRTKQREILLGYFEAVPGVHVTAGDICEYFKAHGAPIGQSTIYRNLESLVDEGVIKKYVIDGNSPACFEDVQPDGHEDTEICFHCKCEKCGRLIHLDCDELNEMQSYLKAEHRGALDTLRTVYYEQCEQSM